MLGGYLLAIELAVFALTTILGWSFYGEKCWEFLIGAHFEKLLSCAVDPGGVPGRGCAAGFYLAGRGHPERFYGDPNLLSLILLSPVVVQLTRAYFAEVRPAVA